MSRDVAKTFNGDAAYYDLFTSRDYGNEAARLRARFPDAVYVLEIGAGTGRLTHELEKLGFSVTPLEPCAAMRAKWPSFVSAQPRTYTIQQLICAPRQRFDLIVAHYDVFNYLPPDDFERAMSKIRRLARKPALRTDPLPISIDMWDPNHGITGRSHKKVGKVHRWRFARRRGDKVIVRFLYLDLKRFRIRWSRHELYLHRLPPEALLTKRWDEVGYPVWLQKHLSQQIQPISYNPAAATMRYKTADPPVQH